MSTKITAESIYRPNSINFLVNSVNNLTDSGEIPEPDIWAAKNRYMPSEITENYGMWDATDVPHLVEPLNRVHPDDPTTHITLMKSVQSAGTVSFLENAMGFWTKYKLGSCAFFTSSKGVAKVRSSSALDVLIDHGGLSKLLKPISSRMKRKSADTSLYKEFAGGTKWLMSSYGSVGDMKSNSFNLMALDEWDEAGMEIADQGDVAGILEGRSMAQRMFKMLYVSTPSRMETSRIYKSFIQGDQRRFFVPCPICGEHQILRLKNREVDYGLTFSMKKDKNTHAKILDTNSVRYICQHCEREFFEGSKRDICNSGEWRETWQGSGYKPKSPNHKSYHAPGFISQFLPWERICQQYVNTDFGKNILLYKDFVINYQGDPWAKVEKHGSWEMLRDRAEDYCLGEVPDGGLILYGGVDVQGDRLELAVVAVGADMEKWVVDYKVFYGDPSKLDDPATWGALHNHVYATKYDIHGAKVTVSLCAIDTGFDAKQLREKDWTAKRHTVFNFVAPRQDKFVAIKGGNESKGVGIAIERRTPAGSALTKRYELATSVLKDLVFNNIDECGGPYTLHFPRNQIEGMIEIPIGDDWYKQFMSERFQEISPGKMGWKKIHQRNEVLDTVVYAIACMYMQNIQSYDRDWFEIYLANLKRSANR